MRGLSRDTYKLALAVVIGPISIVPAVLIGMTTVMFFDASEFSNYFENYKAGAKVAIMGTLYGWIGTIVYGLPSYLILRKFNKNRLPVVLILSLLPALTLTVVDPQAWRLALVLAYFCIIVSGSCWYVANKL